MAIQTVELRKWELIRSDEGQREYMVSHQVTVDDKNDNPYTVLNAPGLPTVGSVFNFGNSTDSWAFCTPRARVSPRVSKEPCLIWDVDQWFSTVPRNNCEEDSIEDPLLQLPRISGSFVKYTKEVTHDRKGNAIKSSSHEQFRGPQVEFDHNRPTVRIGQNVADLQLETFSDMIDKVNDGPMWGLPKRCIKLSNVSWERRIYGTCFIYFTRDLEFDIDVNTFDRDILDEGKKVLNGQWGQDGTWQLIKINGSDPDPENPSHFIAYKDRNGENTRVLLDGQGKPLDLRVGTGTGSGTGGQPVSIRIEYYEERNFFELGVPANLTAI